MFTSLFNTKFFKQCVVAIITFSFIMTSGPVGVYANVVARDRLRKPSLSQSKDGQSSIIDSLKPSRNTMKDGGKTALEQGVAQAAMAYLIQYRDNQYMSAVGATNTADLVVVDKDQDFAAGHDVLKAMIENGNAVIASNILCYNQIEGHLKAAMDQNAIAFLEVARSQLGYALDAKKVVAYTKEVAKKIGCNIPIVIHLDHNQYTQDLFDQKAILKKAYEEVNGKDSFKDKMSLEEIDLAIVQKVQDQLKANLVSERAVISGITESSLKAGFTSIAIDASTIFDAYASNYVMDYYGSKGTAEEKLIVELEKNFGLRTEWGIAFLKADPQKDAEVFIQIRDRVIAQWKELNRTQAEIDEQVKGMEQAFGALTKEAQKAGLDPKAVMVAFDKVRKDRSKAQVAGQLPEAVLASLTQKQKLMIIPGSNAEETAFQLKKIDEIVADDPKLVWLKGRVGKEMEIGHVDQKVPNPRRGGKLEAKMTDPMDVQVMKEYMVGQGVTFDVVATNNGSGHGTEYGDDLSPVSQVGKIAPDLTNEFAQEIADVSGAVAQHGTSGSAMPELAYLAQNGIVKFNVATNYQQIVLNVLSLLDDGIAPVDLLKYVSDNADSLIGGLSQGSRDKMKKVAEDLKSGAMSDKIDVQDSEFLQFLKVTYAWGKKKGKVKDTSKVVDIGLLFAKEFKRAFKDMDAPLKSIGQHKLNKVAFLYGGGPAPGQEEIGRSIVKNFEKFGVEVIGIQDGWKGFLKMDSPEKIAAARKNVLRMQDLEGFWGKKKITTMLRTSREAPYSAEGIAEGKPAKIIKAIKDLGVDAVISSGGDDTSGTAAQFFAALPEVQFMAMCKTIDNDIALEDAESNTFGFLTYVHNAVKTILDAIEDYKFSARVGVAEIFGRKSGAIAAYVGARVGATVTLVPEKEVDLKQLVETVKEFYKKNKWAYVLISEGISINYEKNKEVLDRVFEQDPVAREAFKKATEAKERDGYGNPKLENSGLIINAVLATELKKDKIKTSLTGKKDYDLRSTAASKGDIKITSLLAESVVKRLVSGETGKLLYVNKDQVKAMTLRPKLGGRKLDILGKDKIVLALANVGTLNDNTDINIGTPEQNQKLFTEAYDSFFAQTNSDTPEEKYDDFELSYPEMTAVLWKLSQLDAYSSDNHEEFNQIVDMLFQLAPEQLEEMKRLASVGYFKKTATDKVLEIAAKEHVYFANAFNGEIASAGAFADFIDNNFKRKRFVIGRSMVGPKQLNAVQFKKQNDNLSGAFLPYQVENLSVDPNGHLDTDGADIDTLIVPASKDLNRPEVKIPYFNPPESKKGADGTSLTKAVEITKKLNMAPDIMVDFGPGAEDGERTQPERYKQMLQMGYNIVSASPTSKGLKAMLESIGLKGSQFTEAVYSVMRQKIDPTVRIVDTGSCSTNANITPLVALDKAKKIKKVTLTIAHSTTASNKFYPGPSGRSRSPLDEGRGVSHYGNLVPASTNLEDMIKKLMPHLTADQIEIRTVRGSWPQGSLFNMDVELQETVESADEIAAIFKALEKTSGGVFKYYEPRPDRSLLHASKIVGWPQVSIIDGSSLKFKKGTNSVSFTGWYDNQAAAPGQMLSYWAFWVTNGLRLQKIVDMKQAAALAAPAAVLQDGGETVFSNQERAVILNNDLAVYNKVKNGFEDVVSAVSRLRNVQGAVVIGANTIFDNASSMAALFAAKRNAADVVKFIVWAKDDTAKKALLELGVGNFADIHVGLKSAVEALTEARIAKDKIAFISSDLDMNNIQAEFTLSDASLFFTQMNVKNIRVETPQSGNRINAMPIVFAKAFAMIFKDAVKAQLQNMANGYAAKGLITAEDVMSITQLTAQVSSSIPLVTVSDEVAAMQMTYANTLNKI